MCVSSSDEKATAASKAREAKREVQVTRRRRVRSLLVPGGYSQRVRSPFAPRSKPRQCSHRRHRSMLSSSCTSGTRSRRPGSAHQRVEYASKSGLVKDRTLRASEGDYLRALEIVASHIGSSSSNNSDVTLRTCSTLLSLLLPSSSASVAPLRWPGPTELGPSCGVSGPAAQCYCRSGAARLSRIFFAASSRGETRLPLCLRT